jgi:phosphoribosyl 1,2-cyclic phosphodiesterase
VRFASLGSGSRGNATLVEGTDTRLLLDCGFAAREVEARLDQLGVAPDTLDAILVTHEHQDHIKGVGALARRYRLPVWMTPGTHRQGRFGELPELHLIAAHQGGFRIGGVELTPFPIPHDAREPVQFLFAEKRRILGALTDAGSFTPHILEILQECDALLLECNHDPDMLARGPYPPYLQRRVGGGYGHLSNRQAGALLGQLDHGRLQHLVAAHLSEKNNTPELARDALLAVSSALEGCLSLTSQERVSGWFEL